MTDIVGGRARGVVALGAAIGAFMTIREREPA
jgi:hypothetical protein